jgi:hypothetical protein
MKIFLEIAGKFIFVLIVFVTVPILLFIFVPNLLHYILGAFFALSIIAVVYDKIEKRNLLIPLPHQNFPTKQNQTEYVKIKTEYVYILSNISMPGLIKIGRTNRSVDERLRELNNTSLPTQFIVEHTIETSDSKYLEKMVHKNFDKHRINENREFFRIHHEIVIEYAKTINKSLN